MKFKERLPGASQENVFSVFKKESGKPIASIASDHLPTMTRGRNPMTKLTCISMEKNSGKKWVCGGTVGLVPILKLTY